MGIVVAGQIGRDLILRTAGLPGSGGSTTVTERREQLGGKGANQAVGLAQLGVPVALVGVVGDDVVGPGLVEQARLDGIDVSAVSRRGRTALLVDVVDEPGSRRLLEDVPEESLLTLEDLDRADSVFEHADVVSIQLQQPGRIQLAAAHRARRAGAPVVADGLPAERVRDALLPCLTLLRCDAHETEQLTGSRPESADQAEQLAHEILSLGPALVAIGVPGQGDVVVWASGCRFYAYGDAPTVDPTGAGDAFMAGLVAGLHWGRAPEDAGRLAAAAAVSTVGRLGGRPDLGHLRPLP